MDDILFKVLPEFRSLSFLLYIRNSDEQKAAKEMLKDASLWLKEYDIWYKEKLKITNDNLYLVYNRNVSLVGDGLIKIIDCIENLYTNCLKKIGFSMTLSIGADECVQNFETILKYIKKKIVNHLFIRESSSQPVQKIEQISKVIETFISEGSRVDWIGSVNCLLSTGVLNSDTVNSNHITIYPKNYIGHKEEDRVIPCSEMINLYVDGKRNIYPCFPLIGVESMSIGTLTSKKTMKESIFNNRKKLNEIYKLMHEGPQLDMLTETKINKNYRKQCSIHKSLLIN